MKDGFIIAHITKDGIGVDRKVIEKEKVDTTKLTDVEAMFNTGKPMFVEFYMNDCGHCVNLLPEWEKLIKHIKETSMKQSLALVSIESGMLSKINDNNFKSITQTISGFPTLGAILNKKFIPYEGGRTAKDMIHFINNELKVTIKPIVNVKAKPVMQGGRKQKTRKSRKSRKSRKLRKLRKNIKRKTRRS